MSLSASGLADALNRMNAPRPTPSKAEREPLQRQARVRRAASPREASSSHTAQRQPLRAVTPTEPIVTFDAEQASRARARASRKRQQQKAAAYNPLMRNAVPVLITMGLLLLVPAVWAVLILAGLEVWKYDDPKATQMATAMLVAWPMALGLFGGAAFFWQRSTSGK